MGVIRNISVKVFEENIPDLMKKAIRHFGHLIIECLIALFSRLRANFRKIIYEKAIRHILI